MVGIAFIKTSITRLPGRDVCVHAHVRVLQVERIVLAVQYNTGAYWLGNELHMDMAHAQQET